MKNKYEWINEMKTAVPETDFTENDRKMMREAVYKIGRREKKRKMRKLGMAAACFVILLGGLSLNQNVRAMVKNITTGAMEYLGLKQGYQLARIGDSGLDKPISRTKNGVTVRLNQLICSDGEVFLDYSVSRKDLRKQYEKGSDDYMGTGAEFRYEKKDVSEKLFRKWESGTINNDMDDPWLKKATTSGPDTMEFLEIHGGTGFLYEGKKLEIKIVTYCEGEKNEFLFPVTVEALFQEKEKNLDQTVKIDEKQHITFQKIRSTFSKIIVDGYGTIEDIRFLKVFDESGAELNFTGGQLKTDEKGNPCDGSVRMEFIRNRSTDWENYKIQILNKKHQVAEEFYVGK